MTVTASDPFRSSPRISRNRFRQVLQHHAAPGVIAERDTGAYYDAIVARGIDPLLILAMFNHESTMGRYGMAVTTHSWGNTRPPSFGVPHLAVENNFSVYRDWLDGVISTAARLASTTHVYHDRTAIRDIFVWPPKPEVVWAPAGDANNPNGYLNAVIRDMNSWADVTPAPAGDMAGVPFVPADGRHHTKGRTVAWPDLLIQHHTDGYDSLGWLTTSANSDVSATYLNNRDGTVRAQLVRHSDTPHTTGGILNPRSITSEWERKWGDPTQYDVPDTTYRNLGKFWADVVLIERQRGNPNFQGIPTRRQLTCHKCEYPGYTCPGNLDIDRIYRELVAALDPHRAWPTIPDSQPDPWRGDNPWNKTLWIPNVFVAGIQREGFMHSGYAVSEAFAEDNKVIQYFERKRWELNENGTVTAGLVGYEAMVARYPERRT